MRPCKFQTGKFVHGVGGDVTFEDVFLFFKPFSRRCHLMVIGLQSASVRALIWVKDRPVSSRTARRILQRSAGEFFFGVYHLTFCSYNSQDLLRNVKWLSYYVQPRQRWCVAHAQQSCHVQRQKDFLPLPSRGHDSVTAWRTIYIYIYI